MLESIRFQLGVYYEDNTLDRNIILKTSLTDTMPTILTLCFSINLFGRIEFYLYICNISN